MSTAAGPLDDVRRLAANDWMVMQMNVKLSVLASLAYVLVTFPLAAAWHALVFPEPYRAFGYFDGEPNFQLGLLSIVVQGGILSFLFPYVRLSGPAMARGLKYGLIVGAFFWTSHVLAFVAKQSVDDAGLFVAMESFYLVLQFGIFGGLIGYIYRNAPDRPDHSN